MCTTEYSILATAYLVQEKVWVNFVCCDIRRTARAALLVHQVHCDALKTESMAAVGDKWVSDHAHTYRAGEVVLSQSHQLGCSNYPACIMINLANQLLCRSAHFTADQVHKLEILL